MGRGRPPKKKQPKPQKPRLPPVEEEPEEANELAYAVGAEVEVRSDDDGFRGSCYEATIAAHLDGGGGYQVAYSTLIDDNGDPLHEVVAVAGVRQRPPRPGRPRPFDMYDMVDALHNDGWWAGVVSGVPSSPEQKYTVSFPTSREVIEFPASLLRPRLEFEDGSWVPAVEANHGADPLFAEGDKVEVSWSGSIYGESWYPATVLKTIGVTNFLVRYRHAGMDGELVTEILDSQYIRPARTSFQMESKFRFGPSFEVEVFHEGKWCRGVIWEVSSHESSKKYVVKVKSQETGMEEAEGLDILIVQNMQLRPRYDWDGKKWIRRSMKRPANRRAQFISGKRPISPILSTSSDSDEIRHEPCSGPNKKARKDVVLGNRLLKHDSSLTVTSHLEVPSSKRISMPSMVQKELPQTSLFGVFGQLRPLPRGPVLGKQTLQQELSSTNGTKEPSISQENQSDPKHSEEGSRVSDHAAATDEDRDMLPIAKLKNFRSKSFPTTDVLIKVKNRMVDFSNEEADHGLVMSEKSAEANGKQHGVGDADVQNELPNDLPDGHGVLSQQNELSCMDSTLQANNQGSHESGVSESCELNRQDDLPQEDHTAAMEQCATEGSVPIDNSTVMQLPSTTTLEKIADANMFPYDSRTQEDGNKPSKAEEGVNLPISKNAASMEHDFDGQFSGRSLFVLEDTAVDLLPSTEDSEDNEQEYLPHEDHVVAMVECATKCSLPNENLTVMQFSCTTPILLRTRDTNTLSSDSQTQKDGNVPREAEESANLPLSKNAASIEKDFDGPSSGRSSLVLEDVVVDLLPSTENCEANMQDDDPQEDHSAAMVECVAEGSLAAADFDGLSSGRSSDVLEGPAIDLLTSTENCGANIQNDVSQENHIAATVECVADGSPPIENLSITHFSCGDGSKPSKAEETDNLSIPKNDESTLISKNTASTEHDYDGLSSGRSSDVHESIMGDLPSDPVPNKNIPFVKSSSMWASIEAMDIFRKVPQQPHFLQLQHYFLEFREGMALGFMISFANLAESIVRLHIQDDKALFEEKMRSLSFLEANGFDVKPMQSRLKMLLQIRNGQIELKSTKEKVEEKIAEKEVDNNQLDAQINILNMAILELEQQANLFHEKVQSLLMQKMSNNSEISRLKMDVSEVEESYLSADQHFNSVVAVPW